MFFTSEYVTNSYGALLFDEIEEYLEFIEAITKYLKEHPNNATAYNNRGLAYAEIGEYENALKDFTKAIETDSSNAIHFSNRAYLYGALKNPEKEAEDTLVAKRLKNSKSI